jgi:hypothetical protein
VKIYELRSEGGLCLAVLHESAANKLVSEAECEATSKNIDGYDTNVFIFTRDMATVFPINGWTIPIYKGSYLRRQ